MWKITTEPIVIAHQSEDLFFGTEADLRCEKGHGVRGVRF